MRGAVCKIKPFKLFRIGCVTQTPHWSESKKVTNKCRLDGKTKEEFDCLWDQICEVLTALFSPWLVPVQGTKHLERCAFCYTKCRYDSSLLLRCYFESFMIKFFLELMLKRKFFFFTLSLMWKHTLNQQSIWFFHAILFPTCLYNFNM